MNIKKVNLKEFLKQELWLTGNTLVRTSTEWIPLSSLNNKESLCVYNLNTGKFNFIKPYLFSKRNQSSFDTFWNINGFVIPDHLRIFAEDGFGYVADNKIKICLEDYKIRKKLVNLSTEFLYSVKFRNNPDYLLLIGKSNKIKQIETNVNFDPNDVNAVEENPVQVLGETEFIIVEDVAYTAVNI